MLECYYLLLLFSILTPLPPITINIRASGIKPWVTLDETWTSPYISHGEHRKSWKENLEVCERSLRAFFKNAWLWQFECQIKLEMCYFDTHSSDWENIHSHIRSSVNLMHHLAEDAELNLSLSFLLKIGCHYNEF